MYHEMGNTEFPMSANVVNKLNEITQGRILQRLINNLTYKIKVDITKVIDPLAQAIKIYPNPTSDGRVIVQGLSKGNRVQVFNAAGVTMRNLIVENATDYVSLAAQPAGIYIFVISNGDQHINIQKIVKK